MARPDHATVQPLWAERYAQLLQASGLEPETVLAQPAQTFKQRDEGFLSLAQCLAEPERLIHQVHADCPNVSTPTMRRAYASVLQQDLALNVIAPLAVQLFRDGEAPVADPEQIFLTTIQEEGQRTGRWFQAPGLPAVDEQTFISGMATQTSQWYPTFRQQLKVSPGAYWSSIGLGLGAPFSMIWNLANPTAICSLAQGWLEQFNNETNRFIDWIPAVFNEKETAIPQRKGCCLKYLLPEGGYCGTCGVYRKERLARLNQPGHCRATKKWQPGQ